MTPHHLLSIVVIATATTAFAGDLAPPRYAPHVGQHLIYEGDEVAETGGRRLGIERRTELRIVRQNDDGTWRIIVNQRHIRFSEGGDKRQTFSPRFDLYTIDLSPTGVIPTRALDTFGVLDRMFPELPASAAIARNGWSFDSGDVVHVATPRGADPESDGTYRFEVIPTSPMMAVHGFSAKYTYDLDPQVGLPSTIANEHFHRERKTRVGADRLVSVESIDADDLATLAADVDIAETAERTYRRSLDAALATGDPERGQALLAQAIANLEAQRPRVTNPFLGTHLETIITQHHTANPYQLDRLARAALVVGKPAPDWTLPDLDGTGYALSAHRGRVLVLDFWYRNCSWCLRAMPQIERVHERFEGEAVDVLGMNVDRDRADARFVVDIVKPKYPTLCATRQLGARYGARGYPTIAIIDQEGVVRRLFNGYSARLAEEIEHTVRGLLAR